MKLKTTFNINKRSAVKSSRVTPEGADEDEEEARRAAEARQRRFNTYLGVGIPLFIVAMIVGGVLEEMRKDARESAHKSASASTATSRPTPTMKPSNYSSVPIPSCTCVFGDGQSTPRVTLALLAAPTRDPLRAFRLQIVSTSGFVETSGEPTLRVPDGAVLSLPEDGGAPPSHMGVACDTGFYVLVAGDVATGWSSVDAAYRWTTKLPAPMLDSKDAGAPPVPGGTDFDAWCSPLAVDAGRVAIPLVHGRRASLALKDGKLR